MFADRHDGMFASVYDDFLSAAFVAGGRSECKLRIIESARRAVDRRRVLEVNTDPPRYRYII